MPPVNFIETYKETNNSLPSYREYYLWSRNYYKDYCSDLTQEVDSLIGEDCHMHRYIRSNSDIINSKDIRRFKNADWSKDYAISAWRGEWTEYYFSWSDKCSANNYGWSDGFLFLGIYIFIGLLPFTFWWIKQIYKRKTKKAAANNTYM